VTDRTLSEEERLRVRIYIHRQRKEWEAKEKEMVAYRLVDLMGRACAATSLGVIEPLKPLRGKAATELTITRDTPASHGDLFLRQPRYRQQHDPGPPAFSYRGRPRLDAPRKHFRFFHL
jgi:hypothetical protein